MFYRKYLTRPQHISARSASEGSVQRRELAQLWSRMNFTKGSRAGCGGRSSFAGGRIGSEGSSTWKSFQAAYDQFFLSDVERPSCQCERERSQVRLTRLGSISGENSMGPILLKDGRPARRPSSHGRRKCGLELIGVVAATKICWRPQ